MGTQYQQIIRKHWPFGVGLIAGMVFFIMPIVGWQLQQIPGDMGDVRFNMYLLELGYQHMFCGLDWYWDAPFMWPEMKVISYSDNLFGTVPFFAFFRMLGADRETAFQCWFMILMLLNYSTAYFVLYRVFKTSRGACLGAFVFAFSIAILGQIFHAQTFPRFVVPLLFWAVWEYHATKKTAYLGLSFFLFVYQVYCGIYLGLLVLIPYAFFGLGTVIINIKSFWNSLKQWKHLTVLVGSLVLSLLWLLDLMMPYMSRAKKIGYHSYEQISDHLPTLTSHFFSPKASVLYGQWLSFHDGPFSYWWNHQLFMGMFSWLGIVFLLGCLGTALYKIKHKENAVRGLFILSGLITSVLYFRTETFSLYQWVYELPGFGSMSATGRVVNILLFFGGTGLTALYLFLTKKTKRVQILFWIGFVLLVLDNAFEEKFPAIQKEAAQNRVQVIIDKMEGFPEGGVLSYEPIASKDKGSLINLDGMLAAQSMRMKSINGYTARAAPGFWKYWGNPNEQHRNEWLQRHPEATDSVYVVH